MYQVLLFVKMWVADPFSLLIVKYIFWSYTNEEIHVVCLLVEDGKPAPLERLMQTFRMFYQYYFMQSWISFSIVSFTLERVNLYTLAKNGKHVSGCVNPKKKKGINNWFCLILGSKFKLLRNEKIQFKLAIFSVS